MSKAPQQLLNDEAEKNFADFSRILTYDSKTDAILLGKYVPCAFGVIDMLILHLYVVYVVSFKTDQVGDRDLGEIMRNVWAVKTSLDVYGAMSMGTLNTVLDHIHEDVVPVIVAPSFDNSLMVSPCQLIKYTQTQGGISYSAYYHKGIAKAVSESNRQLVAALKPASKLIAGLAIGDRIGGQLGVQLRKEGLL